MTINGTRIVVIGGTSGIGFAVAELARAQGASIVVGSSNEANVAAAIARLPGATGHAIDVRDEASVEAWFAKVGAFDHLVMTAGDWNLPMRGGVREVDLAASRELLAVRFWGSIAVVKHGSKAIAATGSIVLTSGMLVHRPMKGAPLATAMGGAMEHLARGLAVDLAPIRVNAVCPGLVLTEHVERSYPEAMRTAMTAAQPVPRPATTAEAAQAYVYAMANSYITGQILPVDGGGLLV